MRMQFEILKNHIFELTQVAFWDGQEADNEFNVTCDPFKHRFFNFTQVEFWVFWVVKRKKMRSQFMASFSIMM